MTVGIIQSSFIPWRGYFDFIDDVDLFIFHDDLQYTKGDWRNRNKIKTAQGLIWITVPVKYHNTSQLICDTSIDYSTDWVRSHINILKNHYSKAKYYNDYPTEYFELLKNNYNTISELNVTICRWVMGKLSISTPIMMSRELNPKGNKTNRLIDILKKVGATNYISGPTAKGYIETEKFMEAGIGLEYKGYGYLPYPQLWGGFEPNVTVLDLLFNCGHNSNQYLKSYSKNEIILENSLAVDRV